MTEMQVFSLLTSATSCSPMTQHRLLACELTHPRQIFSETWLQINLPHPVTRHQSVPKHPNDKGLDLIQDHMFSSFSVFSSLPLLPTKHLHPPLLRVVSTSCLSCLNMRLPRQSLSLPCRIQQTTSNNPSTTPSLQLPASDRHCV